MSYAIIISKAGGYLPEAEPIEIETLKEAKAALVEEFKVCEQIYGSNPQVVTPLKYITRKRLAKVNAIIYAVDRDEYIIEIGLKHEIYGKG